MWAGYIDFLEKKRHGKIVDFVFRDKIAGKKWCSRYSVASLGKTRIYWQPSALSYYYFNFLKGKTYRSSCYACPFASPKRQGEITICDYWGYSGEKVAAHNEQLNVPTSKEKYDANYMQIWKKEGAKGLERLHRREHWKAYLAHLFKIF